MIQHTHIIDYNVFISSWSINARVHRRPSGCQSSICLNTELIFLIKDDQVQYLIFLYHRQISRILHTSLSELESGTIATRMVLHKIWTTHCSLLLFLRFSNDLTKNAITMPKCHIKNQFASCRSAAHSNKVELSKDVDSFND